jgi:DNA-binding IclR family transcriptional regulator
MTRSRNKPARIGPARRPNYSVPALDKALDILEHLSGEAVPLTQAQLARALQRNPSELFRMLTCLEERGYLRRDPGSGAYSLTLKLFELSRTHSPYENLLKVAQPKMRELADTVRESCHLTTLYGTQVLVLAQADSPKPFRLSVEVGSLHPVSKTTSGRLFMAHMPDDARAELLERDMEFGRLSPKRREALFARLEVIRRRGYEQSENERFEGSLDLGCLVGSPESRTGAALVIALLRQKEEVQAPVDLMLRALQRCARAIGETCGLIGQEAVP